MSNIVFLSSNVLQCKHQNTELQKNISSPPHSFQRSNSDKSNLFSEKYLKGFTDLLNTIKTGDVVYFTLTPSKHFKKTIQFVLDLVLACQYNNSAYIIYDYSKCNSIKCKEASRQCQEIKEILENCDVPVVYLDNTYSVKFNKAKLTSSLDIKFLNQMVSHIHQIFDLKNEVQIAIDSSLAQIYYKSKVKPIEINNYLFHLN